MFTDLKCLFLGVTEDLVSSYVLGDTEDLVSWFVLGDTEELEDVRGTLEQCRVKNEQRASEER